MQLKWEIQPSTEPIGAHSLRHPLSKGNRSSTLNQIRGSNTVIAFTIDYIVTYLTYLSRIK